MSDVKLIISDIDGTPVDSRGELLPTTISGIRTAVQRGTNVVLASARPPRGMFQLAQQLGIDSTMIAYNGALTAKTNAANELQVFEQRPIPQTLAQAVNRLVMTHWPDASINVYANNDWFVAQNGSWEQQEAAGIGFPPHVTDLTAWLEAASEPVHKILIMAEPAIIRAIEKALTASTFAGLSAYRSKDTYLEIVAAGVTKAAALRTLLKDDGLTPDQVIAFGDNFNDVAMLQMAGIGVAMGNAPAQVKAAADLVTTDNDQPGIQRVLARYFK
ncbi:HAD family phosphatase [Lactiplantibacillus garii]|uniref:HAD family phosphatase n=1 Tax=Lactiplantibacillus garii TaxID=2306423 RepID=A0A426D5J4_9LACO|nr:Cof-type HAD-IIB family hydrolase [Lactiplantibacillus garii]RRK09927.1 HAD family phosphatase [Lactiplantibacillus garii]